MKGEGWLRASSPLPQPQGQAKDLGSRETQGLRKASRARILWMPFLSSTLIAGPTQLLWPLEQRPKWPLIQPAPLTGSWGHSYLNPCFCAPGPSQVLPILSLSEPLKQQAMATATGEDLPQATHQDRLMSTCPAGPGLRAGLYEELTHSSWVGGRCGQNPGDGPPGGKMDQSRPQETTAALSFYFLTCKKGNLSKIP